MTDGLAGLALALEPTHKGVINYKPRSPKEGIIDFVSFWRIILVSFVMLVITFTLYIGEMNEGASIERARTVAFATMGVLQILNMLNSRSLRDSIFRTKFFSNIYIIFALILSSLLTYLTISNPSMQKLFTTVSLGLTDWIKIVTISLSIILIVELEKYIRKIINDKKAS
jgi:Ca2+-transporting ATPase